MDAQLLETWEIHNRIVIYVLDAVAREALESAPGAKGRSAGEMFAHLHNVRLMWLKSAGPDLLEGTNKVEKEDATDKDTLRRSLEESGRAIGTLLQQSLAAGGKVKGFKPHASAFLGYLISHEAYHQGEIGIVLAQSGYPLDKKVAYGMWEWGTR